MTKHKNRPYQEVEVYGRKYWDYNFEINNTVYEISVDKKNGDLYINKDEGE